MIQLTDKVYAVKVPDGAADIIIEDNRLRYFFLTFEPMVDLPPGTWRLLFTTKTATEEDARKVVRSSDWHFPEKHYRYVDYKHPYDRENKQRRGEGYGTALESLHSLLRSKGLDDKNYALIEKQSSDE